MLDPEKAEQLGARPGRAFARLKAGEDFTTAEGVTILSADVLPPPPPPSPHARTPQGGRGGYLVPLLMHGQ